MQPISLALSEGFADAKLISTDQIPFNEMFRDFCAENFCGQYGVNYACPPDCGTFAQMQQRVLSKKQALVVQSIWEIEDYMDTEAIKQAKGAHNAAMLRLVKQMRGQGVDCFMAGASGCALCKPCKCKNAEPCAFPDLRYSCMSAYCIHVKLLADRCGMEYNTPPGLLAFFGMVLFD